MRKQRKARNKRSGLGGFTYGLGVVMLEAAAIAGLLWLVVMRARDNDVSMEKYSHAASSPPTLSIEGSGEWRGYSFGK